jgi:hypothetical protein
MEQGFKAFSSNELFREWPKLTETMTEAQLVKSINFSSFLN